MGKNSSNMHASTLLEKSLQTLKVAASDIEENSAKGALARGQVFELVGYFEKAADAYADAYRRDCNNTAALARLALSQLKAGNYDAGLESAIKLTSIDRDYQSDTLASNERVSSMTVLGVALILTDRRAEAQKALETALTINSKDSYAAGRLAQLHLTNGNVKDATELAKNIGDNPRFSDLRDVLSLANADASVLPAAQFADLKALVGIAVPGRPLTVDGKARMASLVCDKNWRADMEFDASELNEEQRKRVGAEWAIMGRGEHASVASFARFILQLMNVGAPPAMLHDAIQAMADEVEHARLCFGLASYAIGADVGPGKLDIKGVLDASESTPAAVLVSTITEGCVNETIAAAHARAAANEASDEAVKTAFTKIADDEQLHSLLAWQFVEWLLNKHPELVTEAANSFEQAINLVENETKSSASGVSSPDGYGTLNHDTEAQVTRHCIAQEIRPSAARLCGTVGFMESGGQSSRARLASQLP